MSEPIHCKDGGKARVLVVDDHPLLRRGFAQLLEQEPDLTVCGEASEGGEALRAIEQTNPDIVIVDIALRGIGGLEWIKNIQARFPGLPILAFSMHDENLYAERALRAGARGYVMKEEASEKILIAIRQALRGEVYLSEAMSRKLLMGLVKGGSSGESSVDTLSDRELEVFSMIGAGHSASHIASELRLSVKTIETHIAHMKMKLNISSAADLRTYAIEWRKTNGMP